MMWLWGIPSIMAIFAGVVAFAAARASSRYDRLLDQIEIEPEDHIGPKCKGEPQGAVHMYSPRRGRHLGIYTEGDGANGRRRASKDKH